MGDRKTAIEMYNAGVAATADKTKHDNLVHAYQLFASACIADPTYGTAHYQCGNNNSDLGHIHAAIANWRRALDCDMENLERAKVMANLGWRLYSIGEIDESLYWSKQALAIDDMLYLGWVNLSLVYRAMDDQENSIEAARKAYNVNPTDADTNVGLAFSLLFGRKWSEGFKYFEERFRWRLQHYLHYPYPKWLGEANKTVFLVADQGLGDTLSFARFVERASKRAAFLHLCIQPELIRLFQHAFVHLPNINLLPFGAPFPQADAWSTFVSLPFALQLSDDEIVNQPHIDYPKFGLPTTWKVPDRQFHIGVSWAGSPKGDIDKHRSFNCEQFLELYKIPGIQLYSLQVGEHAGDSDVAGCSALIRNLSPYIRDVCDTLSILPHLDLVICCESALGHICGLAEKECWIPYSFAGKDYRIGNTGKDVLWYPKHRIFRQDKDARWEPVFRTIAAALREKLAC